MTNLTRWPLAGSLGLLGLLAVAAGPVAAQELPSPAQRTEAQTLAQGLALRQPGEADSTFLRRVLPASYPVSYQRLAYAWRPSAFGKQLFFVKNGGDPEWALSYLFVLDPFEPGRYAVQQLAVLAYGGCDQPTNVSALLFVDVNHDGQKELLAMGTCASLEPSDYKDEEGKTMYGHVENQGTQAYRYAGLDSAGRPHYTEASTPPHLDGLETAAEVRAALARPTARRPRRPAAPPRVGTAPPATKKAGATFPQKGHPGR